MSDSDWDVVVVGAGAAGMLAAERAAERGRRTLLLEKNTKPGVKILMSGGTRCNLTHDTDVAGILTAFGSQGRFLRAAVHGFTPSDVVAYFADAGVATKIEETGKVFPSSDRALDVQRALIRRMAQAGVELRLASPVQRIDRHDPGWTVVTADATITARNLLLTTGGCSYPGCGTRGDAYEWLRQLGHTVVTPRPALVPLTTSAGWISDLSGVTLPDVLIRVVPSDLPLGVQDPAELMALSRKHALGERRSSLLLTHFGLSGPAAMDVSREVTRLDSPADVVLICDFLPQTTYAELQTELQREADQQGARSVARFLGERLPQRLAVRLLEQVAIDPLQRLAELGKASRRELLRAVKAMTVVVQGSRGFAKAEVTAGGVALSEIDPHTMASKCVPNLFIAGELLDVDGPIGGYNFQAAFSTGRLAAESASD